MSETPLEALAAHGALPEPEPEWPAACYWLWLAGILGPANLRAGHVLDVFGTAREAWENRETPAFAAAAGRTAARRCAQGTSPADSLPLLEFCAQRGIAVLTFEDPAYPLSLSRIPDPPLVLFATGELSVLNGRRTAGMVGARRPTQYGAAAAASIGTALARSGAVIVSGLADGLDGESHRAAVAAGAPTIGVLGVPIDKTYPAGNAGLRVQIEEGGGAVLSEYAPGTAPDYKCSFLQRNRIIAALSDVLVVLEARLKSGTMSTVAHAERYGRPICAVPGSIFSPLSEGANALLREGRARMALGAQDILTELGLAAAPAQAPPPAARELSAAARRALACIGPNPVGMELLCEQTGLSMGALLGALSSLEIAGQILALPGRQYVLK